MPETVLLGQVQSSQACQLFLLLPLAKRAARLPRLPVWVGAQDGV
ncbi:hypothetical protein N8546_01355 [bacterium]|nr:hypothetical protein [bacterium]